MATTSPPKHKHKHSIPPKPKPKMNKTGSITKSKPCKTKKPTPPVSPSLSQSSSKCKPSKPHNPKSLISQHKPPSIPSPKKKTKKTVPPPPLNRNQSRSAILSTMKSNEILPRQQSHSTIKMKNNKKKTKKPPKQSSSLTKENNHKQLPNRSKCKPPPLPNNKVVTNIKIVRKPPRKKPPKKQNHQKSQSVQIIGKIPISPVKPICKPMLEHPTIGEFYSTRVLKKNLHARPLPSKPEKVNVYFVFMGKIYKYIMSICLQHKLSQILPKLSSELAGNEEILKIITCELGRNERSLSSISKKINGNNNELKTYDSVIKDPIFIYKNNTYNSSLTFVEIGYKKDLYIIQSKNNNIKHDDDMKDDMKDNMIIEMPYIVILSCKQQDNNHDVVELQRPKTPELVSLNGISNKINNHKSKNKNGHSRSKTQNDIPISQISNFGGFHALSNVLNLQRDNNSRYKDLRKCVENLGYIVGLSTSKQQLIGYINTFIQCTQNIKKESSCKYIDIDDIILPKNGKPRRKRSRSCGGLPQNMKIKKKENKTDNYNNKLKKRHSLKLNINNKRYNQSASDITCNNMIRLDLSSTNPTKLEFNSPNISPDININKTESKFSRLFRRSFSKKRNSIESPKTPIILSRSETDQNVIQNRLLVSDNNESNSDINSEYSNSSENEVSYTNILQQKNRHIKYKQRVPKLDNNSYVKHKGKKRKKKKIEKACYNQSMTQSDNESKNKEKSKKKRRKKKVIVCKDNNSVSTNTKPKPRKYREKKEININCTNDQIISRKKPPPPPPLTPITRRKSKHRQNGGNNSNNNVIRAAIIVQGYLNTNIGNKSNIKWKKYYYTFNKDRLLCSYLTKDCDLSLPIDKYKLNHGKCSFNINSSRIQSKSLQTITVTIQTSKKPIVKHFRGTTSSLEKWKRAFLF